MLIKTIVAFRGTGNRQKTGVASRDGVAMAVIEWPVRWYWLACRNQYIAQMQKRIFIHLKLVYSLWTIASVSLLRLC